MICILLMPRAEVFAKSSQMQTWSITLHGPSGIISKVDTGEAQFVVGTETASDVFTVVCEGVMPRHAWVWISEAGMQVEDLGGGTLVNGYRITERVQVEYPASVQVGELTLVIEVMAAQTAAVSPTPSSMDITIARRSLMSSKAGMDVTSQERTQACSTVQKSAQPLTYSAESYPATEASTLCKYALVREIARGGMGQIYFGEDPQLKRNVAVKVSSVSEGGEDPRFLKEAEILAQLAHPNIVPIHNIGVDSQGRPFYSMKLVKGRTLQAVLNLIGEGDADAIKDYPRATLLTIFRKVCDAMMFAHSKGILHRDLKPENIMVGEYGEVLVMDWGLAKILGEREESSGRTERVHDTGDYGMTLEGEVVGTPQYMSPEQAAGVVAELDQRSDIYSLGGILYAILTLRAPIDGTTLNEVLERVRSGRISSMETRRSVVAGQPPLPIEEEVPGALRAVTLKAMNTERNKRYQDVEQLAADLERYQNGFATSAEEAGALRQMRLWVERNKVLSISTAVLLVVVSGFTLHVIQKGREAREALSRLKGTAPTFALRTREALGDGNFSEALKSIEFAIELEPDKAEYHALRGNVLQVLLRWPEAATAYLRSLELGKIEGATDNLKLTRELIAMLGTSGEANAKTILFEALNAQGRQYEAMAFGKTLGDFWKDRNKDLSKIPELVRRLESKMIPVPGSKILLSKTEFTIGEWKLYLKAEGLPEWKQPQSDDFFQSEEHPVVNLSWADVAVFLEWITRVTGKEWRLPTNEEWEAAVGITKYPWGDYYPPAWDDGNYAVTENRSKDPMLAGLDRTRGTAPVASFKPNALGFYDLGGNVAEWMWDGLDDVADKRMLRGGSWIDGLEDGLVTRRYDFFPAKRSLNYFGFRVAICVSP